MLSRDPILLVRMMVGEKVNTLADVLDKLSRDRSIDVRTALAKNPNYDFSEYIREFVNGSTVK